MNHVRKYKLEITDLKKAKEVDYFVATEVETFFTLQDVWNKLGFKLKRERYGWSGIKGNTGYTLTRIA